MTHNDQHPHKHGHHNPTHQQQAPGKNKALHKNWMTWVVVGLMLAAMLMYVLSDDESLQPGGEAGPSMPAEAAE